MDSTTPIADRLKGLRERLSLTQEKLARQLEVDRSYLSQLEGGRVPGEKFLAKLAAFETRGIYQPALAKGEDGSMRDMLRYAPVITWAEASALATFEEIAAPCAKRTATDCADPHAFGVEVFGDAMEPVCKEGDVALVMPSFDPREGCMALVRLNRGDLLLRIWSLNDARGGSFRLTATKKGYKPIDATWDDVRWVYPVLEVKRVVWKHEMGSGWAAKT